jgi:hypothetical protein
MIKFNEILSTSHNKNTAEKFAANAIFEITVKKFLKEKNFRFLTARNAVLVENITDVKGEEEVIFPSGSEFIIEDVLLNSVEVEFEDLEDWENP